MQQLVTPRRPSGDLINFILDKKKRGEKFTKNGRHVTSESGRLNPKRRL